MKRIFSSALAILLITTAVQAQTDTAGVPRHERRHMQKEGPYAQLNLTAEQQAKLKALRDEYRQKGEALKNEKLTKADRKSQLQALRQQQKAATDAILTPAQKEQLEKMKPEQKGKMRGGKRFNSDSSVSKNDRTKWQGRSGNAGLQKELNLTAGQQAKMKAIRSEYKKEAATLRNDQTLTQEQKREKLRGLMKEQQAELKTVLTKEQQEKLQSLRTERASRNTR
jgi:Spy/CpxP family protein refolding chaperone